MKVTSNGMKYKVHFEEYKVHGTSTIVDVRSTEYYLVHSTVPKVL